MTVWQCLCDPYSVCVRRVVSTMLAPSHLWKMRIGRLGYSVCNSTPPTLLPSHSAIYLTVCAIHTPVVNMHPKLPVTPSPYVPRIEFGWIRLQSQEFFSAVIIVLLCMCACTCTHARCGFESRPRQLIFSLDLEKKGSCFGHSCLLCLVSLNEFTCTAGCLQPRDQVVVLIHVGLCIPMYSPLVGLPDMLEALQILSS